VVSRIKKILWDYEAANNFKAAISHIRTDSPQNANKVKKDILAKIKSLKDQPEKCPPDKLKYDNDGSYRYFVLHRYRISYAITANEIIITRVRHSSMDPLEY
jgi:plasmid stabilization system protein ParE